MFIYIYDWQYSQQVLQYKAGWESAKWHFKYYFIYLCLPCFMYSVLHNHQGQASWFLYGTHNFSICSYHPTQSSFTYTVAIDLCGVCSDAILLSSFKSDLVALALAVHVIWINWMDSQSLFIYFSVCYLSFFLSFCCCCKFSHVIRFLSFSFFAFLLLLFSHILSTFDFLIMLWPISSL